MYTSIVNPISKKNVNINTKLGRKISQIYLKSIGGSSPKPESSYQGAIRNRSSKKAVLGRVRAFKRGRKKVDIDMEKLMSKITVQIWENIVKSNNHNDIIRIVDMLRRVNKDLLKHFTLEKCEEIVSEVRKNYLLQLVENNQAIIIDDNTIIVTVDFNPNECIINETVVEFLDQEMLRRNLEEVNYINDNDIESIINSPRFLLINLIEIPGRTDGNRMPTIEYTIQLLDPLIGEDGEVIDIILDDVDIDELKIIGKIVKLNL